MWNRVLLGIAFTASMTLALAGPAAAAEPNPVAELMRKAAAEEMDNGFCAKINWAAMNREQYVRWLNVAFEGTAKINKLKDGKQCQYDEVKRISSENGCKCVHSTWHACLTGSVCGSGNEVQCRQGDGDWKPK